MRRSQFSGSPFRRIVALSLLTAVAPACGGTIVLPNPGMLGFLQAVFTAAENGGTATMTVKGRRARPQENSKMDVRF